MTSLDAPAKINLALVVGPVRPDGKHEVATVLQRVDLADRISLEPGATLEIDGFPEDTLVRDALLALAKAAAVEPNWTVRIEKRIPVAAGLGGEARTPRPRSGSQTTRCRAPVSAERLHEIAAEQGADVPFFLTSGTQLGTGDGSELEPVELPTTTRSSYCSPDRGEVVDGGRLRRVQGRTRLRRAARPAACRHRSPRPSCAAAERPRLVAARTGASRSRRFPRGRLGSRPDGLRALRR